MTDHILALLTPIFEAAFGYERNAAGFPDPSRPKNPGGIGYVMHDGHEVKCKGLMGPNPRFQEDAAFDPPAEILIQHTIGHFVVDPDHKAQYPDAAICVGNNPLYATFVLADGITFDSENPFTLCPICGQPLTL